MRAIAFLLVASLMTGCLVKSTRTDPNTSSTSETRGGSGNVVVGLHAPTVDKRHDFASGADETITFEIPNSTARYDYLVRFEGPASASPQQVCAGNTAKMVVTDPDGGSKSFSVGSTVSSGPGACGSSDARTDTPLVPGKWTVAFSGQGAVVGVVRVQPHA